MKICEVIQGLYSVHMYMYSALPLDYLFWQTNPLARGIAAWEYNQEKLQATDYSLHIIDNSPASRIASWQLPTELEVRGTRHAAACSSLSALRLNYWFFFSDLIRAIICTLLKERWRRKESTQVVGLLTEQPMPSATTRAEMVSGMCVYWCINYATRVSARSPKQRNAQVRELSDTESAFLIQP